MTDLTSLRSSMAQPVQRGLNPGDGIRGHVVTGFAVTAVLVAGLGFWAGTTSLAGAVIASGVVVVESNVKSVQHQAGGTVAEILVRDGDRVAEGQILVKFDETLTRANSDMVTHELFQVEARIARLSAEALGLTDMTVPAALAARADDHVAMTALADERALFESQLKIIAGLSAQLDTQIDQYQQQIVGLKAQQRANDSSLALQSQALIDVGQLYQTQLVSSDRVAALQLEVNRLQGQAGQLVASIAEIEGKIGEVKLQQLQLGNEQQRAANVDLRDARRTEQDLLARLEVVEQDLARSTVRSPQAGFVQGLTLHTIGGVVGPGQLLMEIVPDSDQLVVDARLFPHDIDKVAPGLPVNLRFTAFDRNTTPECKGSVGYVSADLAEDVQTRASYFQVRIRVDHESGCELGTRQLLPGMPVEVYIATGERNVWSYILKPLTDQGIRAFKE